MPEILFVSKPVEPPWNDGSKTMVRDLAGALTRYVPVVMGARSGTFTPASGRIERVYAPGSAGHALGAGDALRVLARLALGARADLWHFFFQPNPRTSSAARAIAAVRARGVIHTVSSAPRPDLDLKRVLFADRTVVLSRATEHRLLAAGVRGVVRIAPAIAPLPVPSEAERRVARDRFGLPRDAFVVVFPGDLERGEGAQLAIDALEELDGDVVLAMACRAKTAASREAESALRARAARIGVAKRVHWIGETDRILSLLGAADVVVLPSRDLGAKVDLPIVLIEAMWSARPVIVARGSVAEELADDGGAVAIDTDRDALVAALRAWRDDAERARAGARARSAAFERHHPARVASRYEALYDEVLG